MINKVIIMGRLTCDIELKKTQNNIPYAYFTVAVNKYAKNSDHPQADFIPVVAWRKTAEFVSQWFTKGSMIIVEGSIQSRKWQDENGNNRTTIEVIASSVSFGETKKSREVNTGYTNGYQPTPDFDMPTGNSDFSDISDEEEVPF